MTEKRKLEVAVISDIHLGTYGCHAKELCAYLEAIDPKTLVLNGDIIDFWQLSGSYFPRYHMQVLKLLAEMAGRGVAIFYLTGNHDDVLRKFSDVRLGNFSLVDKLVLEIDGKKHWFFHGDVLDSFILEAKWLAKLGSYGYDSLILVNRFFNWILDRLHRPRFSLSKKVKQGVKRAFLHVEKFEKTIADLALDAGYDAVICGHIHVPVIKFISGTHPSARVLYMNSGDWIENLTSLEYCNNQWRLFEHQDQHQISAKSNGGPPDVESIPSQIFL